MDPQDYIPELLKLAPNSPCTRDKRVAGVYRDGRRIGVGWNSPIGGACTDDVCHRIPTAIQIAVSRERSKHLERSCSSVVEHAEAMAMRRAICRLGVMLAHSECDGRTVEESAIFTSMAYERPLAGCELVHLNTEVREPTCNHCEWRADGERPISCHECAGAFIPERLAKPSRRGRACKSCAVLGMSHGLAAIWLLHEDGWQRYPMAEYHREAVTK